MPNLIQSFQGRDIGYLRIVARLWGIELAASDTDTVSTELAAALLDPATVTEIVDSLPAEARSALAALTEAGGKIPWAAFARQFGELREAGPARRDREQVYLHPISAAETLFYRALFARAFFDAPAGAQEFAYIPDDLIPLLERSLKSPDFGIATRRLESSDSTVPLGRLATLKERAHPLPASDRLLDDATTLLAALRTGLTPPETPIPVRVVTEFLSAAKIILPSPSGSPTGVLREGAGARTEQSRSGEVLQAEAVKSFLEMPRTEALSMLVHVWLESETFNELRLVPGLVCEGEWRNASHVTRQTLFDFLASIPPGKWWSLTAFVNDIKEKHPDFQRPAGDYDSWFIKRASDGVYLRGFTHWDAVDGALIRYLITGPLYWLGQVELATPADNEIVTAFRVNEKRGTSTENAKLTVSSNGRITVPRLVPRVARYLISRFCEWKETKVDEYRYRVSTASLKKAREQGLKVGQLLSLLAKNAAAEIPPAFVKALKRWEKNGTEARVEVQTVLKVSRPEVLEELRKSKAGRFLGEILGPTAVVVKPGAGAKVLAALAELGLLADNQTSEVPKNGGTSEISGGNHA